MEPLEADDPQQVGGYRLLRRLGAGGMGRVYLGRSTGGRAVAVKVVRSELADDREFRARFRQEVASARQVGGRWTAPVLDADTESSRPWVATGYVAGPALGAAVQEFGPLPAEAVRVLGIGLAGALAAVHGLGLVHRDVKPSNVLLALDGPRLIDFGIARALDAAALTQSGFVVGSPGYMSPEQANGDVAGPPSDVFSLGAVLAYAATGTAPFGEGVSAAVLLYRVLHEEPDVDGLAGGPLRELVTACLAKQAAERPTPQELGRRLAALGPAEAVTDGAPQGVRAGTVRLGRGGWLPPAVAETVARQAVELLELEAEPIPAVLNTSDPSGPSTTSGPTGLTGTAGAAAMGRTGRRWAVGAAALALVLAGTGGVLAWHPWAPRPVAPRPGPAPTPSRTAPTPTPSASPSRSDTPTDAPSPASTPGAPPSPGPSSPNAIPAAFLGTWSGPVTTANLGSLAGERDTITVRPSAVGAENTTSANTSDTAGLFKVTCRGAWTLVSATPTKLVFSARLTGESSSGFCSAGSTREQLELNADGTLQYTSADVPAGNPTGRLQRVQ